MNNKSHSTLIENVAQHSYLLTLELDSCLVQRNIEPLSYSQYEDVQTALSYLKTSAARSRFAKLLSTLSREEIVFRTGSIAKLTGLLDRISSRKYTTY